MNRLNVWLHGDHVATLSQKRDTLSLVYTPEALERYELNLPLLSIALPLQVQAHKHAQVHPFFDGLLPEGYARQAIAHDFGVPVMDTFGLLQAIGRDCAGAVVLLPEGESPPQPNLAAVVPLTEEQVAQRLRDLNTEPLGVDRLVRISLAGVQNKLVLTRLPSGDWALPIDGLPSTHILKRGTPRWDDMVLNEAFCLAVGRRLGLPITDAAILNTTEPILVVERFDRVQAADGTIRRIHQEDLAQALALGSASKYEDRGGPSFQTVARCIKERAGGLPDLYTLLGFTLLNVAVGNADAHAKNFSVLHHSVDDLRLAPGYDIFSTTYYAGTDIHPAMAINGQRSILEVTLHDMIEEAVTWGVPRSEAGDRLAELVDGLSAAIEDAASDVAAIPYNVVAHVQERVARLRA